MKQLIHQWREQAKALRVRRFYAAAAVREACAAELERVAASRRKPKPKPRR